MYVTSFPGQSQTAVGRLLAKMEGQDNPERASVNGQK